MHQLRHIPALLVPLLLLAVAAVTVGGDAADFEADLVKQAVDLSTSHSEAQEASAKDMESLLHWAIEHSDADALRQKAEAVRRDELIKDYQERKQRVKELSDIISMQPTETQLMQDRIAALTDEATSVADKAAALAELQVLVEPIDNANDLRVLGALQPLVTLLGAGEPPELQAGSAYVLGTAVSNNEKLAAELVSEFPQLLPQLLQLVSSNSSSHEEAANKAMYALARLVAGPAPSARAAFYNAGGLAQLQALMAPGAGTGQRVKARALNLIADLIELTATGDDTSLETWNEGALDAFAGSALHLLQQSEGLEAKEKALHAMRTLLLRRGPAGGAALAKQGAEAVLREELTELDLLAVRLADEATAAAAAAPAAAASDGAGGDAGANGSTSTSSSDSEAQESDEAATAAHDEHQFATYVGHLCADVLHHLAVHHEEL